MLDNQLDYKELEGLSEAEKEAVLKILQEYSDNGNSDTYNNILYSDYDEIPVSIEEFLHNPMYLGKGLINEEGKFTVYPYWVDTLKKIFPDPLQPSKYNTLALTGAIGLGKSFEAVLCCLYELYRMLCLKDPYLYYGLQPIDKITFALMNITLDAAQGVAWDKLQQLVQSSEWFMNHGTVSKGMNPTWRPEKKIELICGSQSRHIIGRAVYFCLDGDTNILTNLGVMPIKNCVGKPIRVPNMSDNGEILWSDECTVQPTAVLTEEYHIELEDGTTIKCTPEHRFMLIDGTYKEAQYLTEEDEIMDFESIGYVYRTTNIVTGATYIGQHKHIGFDRNYYGSGIVIQRSLKKYGKKNHRLEILSLARTQEELNNLETEFISKEKQLNENCLNLSSGAKGGHENYSHSSKKSGGRNKGKISITDGFETKYIDKTDEIPEGWRRGNCNTSGKHDMSRYYSDADARRRNSLSKSGHNNSQYGNGEAHTGEKNGRYGKPTSLETKEKISLANKGRVHSADVNKKKGRLGAPKPNGFGKRLSESTKGMLWYNNGHKQRKYHIEDVPEGWKRGMLK